MVGNAGKEALPTIERPSAPTAGEGTTGWPNGLFTDEVTLGPMLGEVPLALPLLFLPIAANAYLLAGFALGFGPHDGSPGSAWRWPSWSVWICSSIRPPWRLAFGRMPPVERITASRSRTSSGGSSPRAWSLSDSAWRSIVHVSPSDARPVRSCSTIWSASPCCGASSPPCTGSSFPRHWPWAISACCPGWPGWPPACVRSVAPVVADRLVELAPVGQPCRTGEKHHGQHGRDGDGQGHPVG